MEQRKAIVGLILISGVLSIWGCSDQRQQIGEVKDEAMLARVKAGDLRAADEDYFADMDYGYRRDADPSVKLNAAEARGRNTWIAWTFGSDRFWDYMSNHTFGAFDLLKIVSSHPEIGYCTEDYGGKHDNKYDGAYGGMDEKACKGAGKTWIPIGRNSRWNYYGLVNEPCFEKATAPDEYGLWLDKRLPASAECPADPFENETKYPGIKIGARGKTVPVGSAYGKASGVVGLRLFPNPAFDDKAKDYWLKNKDKYYTDPSFYNDKNLVRPHRVGMSCGFCHVGPNPVNPPADPENPKWANLNSNPGAQYFWVDRIFIWNPKDAQANFIFQLFHTSLPGSLDTSFVSTDNINNPRTMNAVYNVAARLEAGRKWKEKLAGGGLLNKQFNDFEQTRALSDLFQPPDTVLTPHVLKDGSDSVGALGALNRVFINIGLFSEEWLLHFRPLIGGPHKDGKDISPIKIADAQKNSVYWQATTQQTPDMALFFLKTARPDRLKDAPNGQSHLTTDEQKLTQGKTVFAENCARCHSSKQPPNLCMLGQPCTSGQIIENSAEYFRWMRAEVFKPDFLDNNFLSTDRRVPITEMGVNACSPIATNSIRDNIWDNFSSETYKQLPSVGEITVYNPVDGTPRQFQLPGGGRGFVRPASLVSVWSTAPYLQNNSVGEFNQSPSVEARMQAFDIAIRQMLWPERRDKDPIIGDKVPGPSYIQRTTARSYLKVPAGYLPEGLDELAEVGDWLHRLLPWLFTATGDVQIGPIPKGTPVGLLSNIRLIAESQQLEDRLAYTKTLAEVLLKLKRTLKSLPENVTDEQAEQAFKPLVQDLLSVSKCPDLIINKGHYFGSNLGDDDKNALIEFLKTF